MLLLVAFAVLLGPVIALYYGWAAAIVWAWFVVPLGAPALSTVQCGGVIYALGALKIGTSKSKDGWEFWTAVILGPLLTLLSAALFRAMFA